MKFVVLLTILSAGCYALPYSKWCCQNTQAQIYMHCSRNSVFFCLSHNSSTVSYSISFTRFRLCRSEPEIQVEGLTSECLREFDSFRLAHKKVYSLEEGPTRVKNFCSNYKEVVEINGKQKSWRAAINEYSDLSWEEFKEYFTMKTPQNCSATNRDPISRHVNLGVAPESMDWRNVTCGETSCVSMVKNQGKCGR
jgi:hypothetical protein